MCRARMPVREAAEPDHETLFFQLLLDDVETRYLLPNVPALLGLTCLTVGAFMPRLRRMRLGRRRRSSHTWSSSGFARSR